MSIFGERVVSAAHNWIGVRYCHQGRTRQGIDCIGLVVHALREAGDTDAPDEENYPLWAKHGHIRNVLEQHADGVLQPEPGDILLFRIGGTEQHIGIYSGSGRMVHVYAQAGGRRGMVCEHEITPDWQNRIVGCYRWRA